VNNFQKHLTYNEEIMNAVSAEIDLTADKSRKLDDLLASLDELEDDSENNDDTQLALLETTKLEAEEGIEDCLQFIKKQEESSIDFEITAHKPGSKL
jgi:hypothetical protein